jgi:ubiquinone/menaquinone biosynthesis C-methylase UbiE
MKSQKQVWNNLAEEWFKLKNNPIKRVLEFLENQSGKILDFGSGAGRHMIKIKKGKMYLLDFSKEMINFAKQKAQKEKIPCELIISPLNKIPFKNNFFDSAIFTSSLHCIKGEKNREKIIKELWRVLKPNAKIIVTVYNKDSKQFKNSPKEKYIKWKNKEERYYYIFNEKEIHNLFEKIKFKIIKSWEPKRSIEFIAQKI